MKNTISTGIAATLFSLSLAASATTITFGALEQPSAGFQYFNSVYEENGYRFTGSLNDFGSAQQNNTDWYMGSAGLFAGDREDTITLQRIAGGTFSLLSIDLAPLSKLYGTGASVNFVGHFNGGGTVNASFKLNNTYLFQSFDLNGFTGLDSVTWVQDSTLHQFDNLRLTEPGQPTPVPEPASLALTGLALAALAGARRKKS
jgi:hypothetical protein